MVKHFRLKSIAEWFHKAGGVHISLVYHTAYEVTKKESFLKVNNIVCQEQYKPQNLVPM